MAGDLLSQSAIEDAAFDAAAVRYPQIPDARIRSEIMLWCGMNKFRYPDPEKQLEALWDALRAVLEAIKAEACGYSVDDLYWYSIPHIKELVVQVCAGICNTRLDEAYADVSRALYRLVDPASRAVIIGVHAGWLEENEGYEESLVALQGCLGGKKPSGM